MCHFLGQTKKKIAFFRLFAENKRLVFLCFVSACLAEQDVVSNNASMTRILNLPVSQNHDNSA